MAPSAVTRDSPSLSTLEAVENNLQPFYVLHKASSQKKSAGAAKAKTRRRIDLSLSDNGEARTEGFNELLQLKVRKDAFDTVWSRIESNVKCAFREINMGVFNEISEWVRESFKVITSLGKLTFTQATCSAPVLKDATDKQLFTALVLTKNMEFVDDLLTFKELGLHLKSEGCHVANLSSQDFLAKSGIGGCLRSLLRQFLMVSFDAADISILATWYGEQGDSPVIVIIDDLERCCGSVLSDFIIMLSEWALKIPLILILGVSTTLDAPRNILSSKALHHLHPQKFVLGTPFERMDAVVRAVLLNPCSGFSIGYKVSTLMRNYFLTQDGTLTSFMRALKIACTQHFSMESLSCLIPWFLLESNNQEMQCEKVGLSDEGLLKNAFSLPSCIRNKTSQLNMERLVHGMSELKISLSNWSTAVTCLYEAGKLDKIQLLDLLCECLDPILYNTPNVGSKISSRVSPTDHHIHRKDPILQKGSFIVQAVHKVRELPASRLSKLLKDWEKLTVDMPQIHDGVKEVLSVLKFDDSKSPKQDLINASRRYASRRQLNIDDFRLANEKAAGLMENMIRNHVLPIECVAFHEIVCFKNVDNLQEEHEQWKSRGFPRPSSCTKILFSSRISMLALIGDPRRKIQVDLLESRNSIKCRCCSSSSSTNVSSMHDSSIMYTLAQEHGDLINLHDWYQSFKSIVLCSGKKGKKRSKHSPSPKKRKISTGSVNLSEASIQARFCKAVTELQITGLIRMPGKRRPDFVQRVAFGL